MATVMIDLSVSVDGYIAGSDDGPGSALGTGGEALFAWMAAGPQLDGVDPRLRAAGASQDVIKEWLADTGAMLSGRRTFEIAGRWAEGHPIPVPIVVLTHEPPTEGEWDERLEFATDLDRAYDRAVELAGDKIVSIAGADLGKQLLAAGKVDEIQLNVAPVLLGGGVTLFDHLDVPVELEQTRVIVGDGVTHLRYRVLRD